MYITIKNLKAQNFLSYENLELTFEDGINIIEGWNEDATTSNGSGKSTVADVLTWALYGMVPRVLRSNEIIRNGAQRTHAEIEFENEFGVQFKVHRSLNPAKLEVWKNGEPIYYEKKPVLQGHLANKILGISYDVFTKTVYFPQNFQTRFLLLTEEERKNILFKIVRLDKFDTIHDEVTNDAKMLLMQYENSRTQLGAKIRLIDEAKELIKAYKIKADGFATEKAKDVASVDGELQSLETELQSMVSKQELLRSKAAKNPEIKLKLQRDIESKQKELEKLVLLREKKATLRSTLGNWYAKDDDYKKELSNLEMTNAPCPYCSRPLDKSFIVSKRQTVLTAAESNLEKIKALEKQVEKIDSFIANHYNPLNAEIDKLKMQLAAETKYDDELDHLESLRSSLFDRRKSLQTHRGKLIVSSNVYLDLIAESKIKIKKMLDEVKSDNLELIQMKEKIGGLRLLRKIFGPHGIKATILDGIINELNQIVKEYLEILYEQSVEVRFEVVEHNLPQRGLTCKIPVSFSMNGKEFPFNALSGGEKRRAILAVDLAISKIMAKRYGNGCNLMILDEVTTDLDEYSRKKFYDLLQYINQNKSIYLIDHSTDAQSIRGANILKVVKKNGISKLYGGGNGL